MARTKETALKRAPAKPQSTPTTDMRATKMKTKQKQRSWKGKCKQSSGCVLHRNHEGECKTNVSFGEYDYYVEKICSERDVLDAKKNVIGLEYAIKWLGWPPEDMTWEPAVDIKKTAPNAVKDWEDEKKTLVQNVE